MHKLFIKWFSLSSESSTTVQLTWNGWHLWHQPRKSDINNDAVEPLLFNSCLNSRGSCEHWKRQAKSYNFSIKQTIQNLHETENTRICSVRETRNSKLESLSAGIHRGISVFDSWFECSASRVQPTTHFWLIKNEHQIIRSPSIDLLNSFVCCVCLNLLWGFIGLWYWFGTECDVNIIKTFSARIHTKLFCFGKRAKNICRKCLNLLLLLLAGFVWQHEIPKIKTERSLIVQAVKQSS